MSENLTLELANYAAGTTAAGLPADVRERAKLIVADELACAAFGQTRPAGKIATAYVAAVGGPGGCEIVGTASRTTAPYAALANGTAGHADELDGAHIVGGHPGATIVHAATAAAQHRGATGAELLNAVVLGYDVGNRLITACGGIFGVKSRLHLHADFFHAVGAAVVACRLLELAPSRYCHAMALSTFQANGLCSLFQEHRHLSKSFCNGQYAFAGVSAGLMAASGFEGCEDVIGAPDGLLAAWGVADGAHHVTESLGHDYAVMGSNFKFLNAGYPIHSVVEAAMAIVEKHGLVAENINSVAVGMPTNAMRVVDNREMHNICVQDMLAAALVLGGLTLRQSPFPAVLDSAHFDAIRRAIVVSPDPALNESQPNGRGATVTITTRDGLTATHTVDSPKGHANSEAIGWADLEAKWTEALPGVEIDRMISLCRNLDEVGDVDDILVLFEP